MTVPSPSFRGVLLTMGDYSGTLAAARLFGRRGTPVILAEWRAWASTRFSRYITQTVTCPPSSLWEEHLEWLLAYGAANPGLFLYPTSDDSAWLYAQHAARLSAFYVLWQPPVGVIYKLLNKKHLHDACLSLGIDTPVTHFPASEAELRQLLPTLPTPFLLKPRTQIGLRIGHKGKLVYAHDDSLAASLAFKEQLVYQQQLLATDSEVAWPMLQAYFPDAMQAIISIAGFASPSGDILALSSRKVLQRPRRLGVGLCFESVPLRADLLARLTELCRHLGYFGIFEAEFIEAKPGESYLLIDFNPRYYGQMGFEIARELPLPVLALTAAIGSPAELQTLLSRSAAATPSGTCIYSTDWLRWLSLLTGWLARKHSWQELRRWNTWRHHPQHSYTDAMYDAEDRWPAIIDVLVHIGRYLRHPRDTIRKFFLDT